MTPSYRNASQHDKIAKENNNQCVLCELTNTTILFKWLFDDLKLKNLATVSIIVDFYYRCIIYIYLYIHNYTHACMHTHCTI